MLPLTTAALAIRHSTYDAGALYDSVLQVTVDGEPRCAATIIASNSSSTSLAISAASCFLKTAALSREQQADCLRGACGSDIIVPASSINLVGGPDSREAPIVARVKRLAVRFTAWWAMADVCSSALCGEGWDVALLELEQGCESGTMPCIPAVGLPTAAPSFGLFTLAVGFGQARCACGVHAVNIRYTYGALLRVGARLLTAAITSCLTQGNAPHPTSAHHHGATCRRRSLTAAPNGSWPWGTAAACAAIPRRVDHVPSPRHRRPADRLAPRRRSPNTPPPTSALRRLFAAAMSEHTLRVAP